LPPGDDPAAFFCPETMSKATTLAAKARATRQYLQTFRRLRMLNRAFDCEHGHFGCAAEPNGACTDELLHLIEAADDSDARS
jgi:hypothetical protein